MSKKSPVSERVPLTRRLTRPGWRDPRLGVGLLLLAGSVALGAWTVDRASNTEPVYAARQALAAGQEVSPADFVVVEANTAAPAGTYVRAGGEIDGVLLRSVGAGELLPATAMAPESTLDQRPIVVEVAGTLPAAVVPGAVVELWHAPAPAVVSGGEADQQPTQVVQRLEVARVASDSSVLGGGAGTSVELLAAARDVPRILSAKAAGGQMVVIPIQSAGLAPAAPEDPQVDVQDVLGETQDQQAGPSQQDQQGEG